MTSLSKISGPSPMLFTAISIVLTFCCSAPLIWLFSNLVVDGVRARQRGRHVRYVPIADIGHGLHARFLAGERMAQAK
jgi:hypothetical protein